MIENERRNKLSYYFTDDPFYKEILQPYIENKIRLDNNLASISDNIDDIKLEVIKRRVRIKALQGILNDIDRWGSKYNKKE